LVQPPEFPIGLFLLFLTAAAVCLRPLSLDRLRRNSSGPASPAGLVVGLAPESTSLSLISSASACSWRSP